MKEIQATAILKVHRGKLPEFKRVAEKCVQSVREKDKGTLQYDWFFNEDQTLCEVREKYRDSEAVLEHMGNLGDTLGSSWLSATFPLRFSALLPMRFWMHLKEWILNITIPSYRCRNLLDLFNPDPCLTLVVIDIYRRRGLVNFENV